MSGQQRQCPSTMRQLPGRRSRLHGKRHFLERGERTWTAVPSATRCEEKQAHCSCASSQRGTCADSMRSFVAKLWNGKEIASHATGMPNESASNFYYRRIYDIL